MFYLKIKLKECLCIALSAGLKGNWAVVGSGMGVETLGGKAMIELAAALARWRCVSEDERDKS